MKLSRLEIQAPQEWLNEVLYMATDNHSVVEIELWAETGADVNAPMGGLGWTPLHLAASKGYTEAVKKLLSLGANAMAKDKKGRTAAGVANEQGHSAIAKLLTHQARIQQQANQLLQTASQPQPAALPPAAAGSAPIPQQPAVDQRVLQRLTEVERQLSRQTGITREEAALQMQQIVQTMATQLRGEIQQAIRGQQHVLDTMLKSSLDGVRTDIVKAQQAIDLRLNQQKHQVMQLLGTHKMTVDEFLARPSHDQQKQQILVEMRALLATELKQLEQQFFTAQQVALAPVKQTIVDREKVLLDNYAKLSVLVDQMRTRNDPMLKEYEENQAKLKAQIALHNPAELKAFYDGFLRMFSAKMIAAITLYSGLVRREENKKDKVVNLISSIAGDLSIFGSNTLSFLITGIGQLGTDYLANQKISHVAHTITTPLQAIELAELIAVAVAEKCSDHIKKHATSLAPAAPPPVVKGQSQPKRLTAQSTEKAGEKAADVAYEHARGSIMRTKAFDTLEALATEFATVIWTRATQGGIFPSAAEQAAAAGASPAPSAPSSPAAAKQLTTVTSEQDKLKTDVEKLQLQVQMLLERQARQEEENAKLRAENLKLQQQQKPQGLILKPVAKPVAKPAPASNIHTLASLGQSSPSANGGSFVHAYAVKPPAAVKPSAAHAKK